MAHNINKLLLASSAVLVLAACEKESNFFMTQEGQLNCRSLTVDYINSNLQTRVGGVDPADFTVNFINDKGETVKSYLYAQMPEIVILPVGEYSVEASYGTNPVQSWDAPYYLGKSASTFTIKAGEITDNVDPIECELSNIRIKVNIDDNGLGILGDDAYVEVKVGDSGELRYDNSKTDTYGYFRYVEGSQTIAATFYGTVDGKEVSGITQTFSDAKAGNSYTINFIVTKPDNVEPGEIVVGGGESGSGIDIDTTMTVKDENTVVDPNEPDDELIVPTDRPTEDPGTEPGGGEQPGGDEPLPVANGPKIIIVSEGLELNKKCHVDNLIIGYDENDEPIYSVAFNVESEAIGGISEFKIVIDSSTLTPDELEGVELSDKLDLVNPGELKDALEGLGFPTGNNVAGQSMCEFDISQFIPLLNMLGSGVHSFNLTISDANGTTTGSIIIEN